jgi:hypothetical protein
LGTTSEIEVVPQCIRGDPLEGNDANDGPPASTADNRFPGRKFHRERATPARWAAFFAAH